MEWQGIWCEAGYFNSQYASLGRRATLSGRAQTWELMLCDSESTFSLLNQTYTVARGDVLCLRPDDAWRMSLPFSGYYVRIRDEEGTLCQRMSEWPRVFSVQKAEDMIAYVRTMTDAQSKGDELLCMAQLFSLISTLNGEVGRDVRLDAGARKKMRDSIRAGLIYIEQHYHDKCTLNDIAAHAGRSPIYFHDVFQTVMGMTPYEYIAQLRLEEAKRLLTMTDEDPIAIAEHCGFCSQSYFNFVFKKAMGMTPMTYRRRAAEKYLNNEE